MFEVIRKYCLHCKQTFVTDEVETCPLCRKSGGLMDPMSAEALQDLAAMKQEQPIGLPTVRAAAGTALTTYRLARLGLAGVVCLGLGILLMTRPTFWSNPRAPTFGDLLPGLGATFVGVAISGFIIFSLVRVARQNNVTARQPDKQEDGVNQPSVTKPD